MLVAINSLKAAGVSTQGTAVWGITERAVVLGSAVASGHNIGNDESCQAQQ